MGPGVQTRSVLAARAQKGSAARTAEGFEQVSVNRSAKGTEPRKACMRGTKYAKLRKKESILTSQMAGGFSKKFGVVLGANLRSILAARAR